MKIISTLIAVFCSLTIFAQVPDNDKIKAEIENPQSKFFYPNLMARYQLGDTTLSQDEYHYLYYGYAFSPNYTPLEANELSDSALLVFQKTEPLTETDLHNLIIYANKELKFDPFSPRTLNLLTYVYGELGDSINERKNYYKMRMVLNTIQSSGSGLEENSPKHVLYFTHPNDLLTMLDLQIVKRTVISRSCEYIQLLKQRNAPKGLYFDFSRIYWKRPSNADQKKTKAPMQFNYMKPETKNR